MLCSYVPLVHPIQTMPNSQLNIMMSHVMVVLMSHVTVVLSHVMVVLSHVTGTSQRGRGQGQAHAQLSASSAMSWSVTPEQQHFTPNAASNRHNSRS